MNTKKALLFFAAALWLASPWTHAARAASSPKEEFSETWDEIGRALRDWADRARDYFSVRIPPREERPLISLMLRNREKLGLSDEQVRRLEQLRGNFEKESIRRDADLRVAEMDLANLTDAPTVEMGKVEAKVREIEKLRAEQRLARIRAIEKAKEQLTAEQRKRLQEIVSDSQLTRLQPKPRN